MFPTYFFFITAFSLLHYSQSLQSGYTCARSVTVTCPQSRKLVILEVTYSSECPNVDDSMNGTSIYAPSRCIGYYRERTSTQCNGKEICIIDNSPEQRPAFFNGKQANCAFRGESINIEYSCVPDFYSSKLPRVDICSLQSLDDIKEGFIHTPNYPKNYDNDLTCVKKVPKPDAGHRLKIYALDFDIESVTVTRPLNTIKLTDWLEINSDGEKLYGTRTPYTLLFDDVIEASLEFKSNLANTKRLYNGFLLYFIVTPVRRSRPSTTKITTSSSVGVSSTEDSTIIMQEKASALFVENRRSNNTGLLLVVIVLSSALVLILCAFLLYIRRNDRRIRYLTATFNSFLPKRPKFGTVDSSENSEETDPNIKLDLSSTSSDDKLLTKHASKEFEDSDHIYSQDPLELKIPLRIKPDNSSLYEYIDFEAANRQIIKSNQHKI